MIVTLLLWCLITLTVFSFGLSFSKVLFKFRVLQEEEIDFYRISILGLCSLSTLLAFVSLFFAIDAIVFFVLSGITIIQLVFYRHEVIKLFWQPIPRTQLLLYAAMVLVVLLYAIQSDYVDNDTGLYHAQAIQWIEKYPAVPGLGNLHAVLGYNFHSFLLSAFFSLAFTGTPFCVYNSWIVLFFSFYCIRNYFAAQTFKWKIIYALFLFICCFLYRWLLCLPFTDISVTILTWCIFLFLMDFYNPDLKVNRSDSGAIIFITAAFTLTCKLSFAFLFVSILFFVIYQKRKEGLMALLKISLMIAVILLPWLGRNIIISGYMFYPVSALDPFKFSWRIPANDVEKQQALITTWTSYPGYLKSSVIQELPDVPRITIFQASIRRWFHLQNVFDKGYIIIFLLSIILTTLFIASRIIFHKIVNIHVVVLWLILLAAAAIVVVNAPSLRFFHGILWICVCIPIILAPNIPFRTNPFNTKLAFLFPAFIVLFFLSVPVKQIFRGDVKIKDYMLMPEPRYLAVETVTFSENNFQAIRPKQGIRCWDENIPCLPCEFVRVKMRGATFRDGFIPVNP